MSQCVSCNNQPNDNDSLGGGPHEGAVTPMVVGIIVGTVVVFVLVLCALFYCAKLENDKARRGMKAEEDDGPVGEGEGSPPPQRPPPPPSTVGDDEGVEIFDSDGDGHGRHHHRHQGEPGFKSLPVERRPSSVTVVGGEVENAHGGVPPAARMPAGLVGGKKKGLFGWGGGKKSSGRGEYFRPVFSPSCVLVKDKMKRC